jgi:hypothetical protein
MRRLLNIFACLFICYVLAGFSMAETSCDDLTPEPAFLLSPDRPSFEDDVQLQGSYENRSFFRGVPRLGSSPALGGGLELSALGWSSGINWMESTGGDGGEGIAFLAYTYPLGPVDLSAGFYGTWLNNSRFDDTLEAYLSVTADPLWLDISPCFTYYFRLDKANGGYGELKLTRLWTVANDKLDLAPYALLGFGDYYSSSYSANHFEAGIGAAWYFTDHWSLGLNAGIVVPLNGARAATGQSDPDLIFGLSLRTDALSFTFSPQDPDKSINPTLSIHTDFTSKQFFRGVPRIGSSPALGGALALSALGWSTGINWMTSTGGGGGEGIAFLDYSYPLGPVDLSAGLYGTWLTDSRFDDTLEAYLSVTSDPLLFGISSSVTYYFRLDEAKGGYGEVKLTRLWTVANDKIDLAPYTLFGFGDYYSSSYSANHFEAGIGAAYYFNDHVKLGLSVALIAPFDDAEKLSSRSVDGQITLSMRYQF